MPRAPRRSAGVFLVACGLVAGLLLALTGFAGSGGVARADTTPDNNANPDFTLTVSGSTMQTPSLTDGQAIPFTVTRTAQGKADGLEIAAVGYGWCASDTQLPDSELPPATFNTLVTGFPPVTATTPGETPQCLDYVNSDLSAVLANGSALPTIAPPVNTDPNVANKPGGDYGTVSSQALAEEGQGGQQTGLFSGISVNCLPSEPCTFAVAVWTENLLTPGQPVVYFMGVPATFVDASAGLACSSPAAGQIQSESPDRLSETITELGIDACRSGYAGGQGLTFNLGSGFSDDEALCAFASGSADLAYSAVGYGQEGSAFSPANCKGGAAPDRPYVAVPIALNAVVLAHSANLQVAPPYRGFPFGVTSYNVNGSQLRITDAQFAQLLSNGGLVDVSGGGQQTGDSGYWQSQLGQGLLALNPTLSGGYTSSCPNCAVVGGAPAGGVAVTSGDDATTYLTTRFLDAVAPTQLVSAPNANVGLGAKPLGTTSNFGLPPPAYDVETYTGRSILAHYMTPLSGITWWALTDAATAAATWGGLDDFAVQSSDSISAAPADANYVAPTTQSMQTAAANMTAQPDGTLLPDPEGGSVGGVEPYPLTYVEYAIAPAQPLLNADCTADTAAQKALSEWLTFLVNQGQSDLPAGMASLPGSLDTQAKADIAKVGTGAPACSPPSPAPRSNAATPSSGGGSSSTSSQSGSSGVSPYSYSALASLFSNLTGETSASKAKGKGVGTGTAGSSTATRAAVLSLAAFGALAPVSLGPPLLGILVLSLLVPGLVYLAARRRSSRVALSEAASHSSDLESESLVDGSGET